MRARQSWTRRIFAGNIKVGHPEGLSSRPELPIPEGDEKRSGGTCCFVPGQQWIGKQKQKPPSEIVSQPKLKSKERTQT